MTNVFDALGDPTRRRKGGRETLYRVTPEPDDAAGWIVRLGGVWDARLERLRGVVSTRRG